MERKFRIALGPRIGTPVLTTDFGSFTLRLQRRASAFLELELAMPLPRYGSLSEFLIDNELNLNGYATDGTWGRFPLKGVEIEAVVLFVDLASFTRLTAGLDPVDTLICVQLFLSWMTGSSLGGRPGIIDKYVGDQMMVVFAKDFGSEDPLVDAVRTAADMISFDAWGYEPHIGLAVGPVVVAYTGTVRHFECSVFGASVSLASRCTGVPAPEGYRYAITLPADAWGERVLRDVLPQQQERAPDGTLREAPYRWALTEAKDHDLKNLGKRSLRQIWSRGLRIPPRGIADVARTLRRELKGENSK